MNASNIAPGLCPDVSNDDYHSGPGVSKSHLDDIAPECGNSPKHYWAKRLNPEREPEVKTEAKILGDAIHKAILEPDELARHFVTVPPDAPKRPSITQINALKPSLESQGQIAYWRDFNREHVGKLVLKPAEMKTVIACRDAIHLHPQAKLLFQEGSPEQAYYAIDPETGELIKCKLDYDRLEVAGQGVDLKTTESAEPFAFGRSATKYRYDVQGTWYPDTIHAAYGPGIVEEFIFVAIEKDFPHAVGIFPMDAMDVPAARSLARRDLARIRQCRESGVWPDFAEERSPLRINQHARRAA